MSASSTADILSVLDGLVAGELPTESSVAVLSDLDRDDAAQLAGRWPSIVPELRVGIIALAVDLATNDVQKDFQRLAYIALEDPVPGVREAGLYSLNDIGGRETAARIAAVLEKETNAGVVAAAASAAGPYVLQHELGQLDAATGDRLVAALRQHAEQDDLPEEARGPVVEALGAYQAPWVDELIRDAYSRDERTSQLSAIVAMGRSANEEWLEYLEEQLHTDDAELRQRVVEACGEIAAEDAVEMLAPLLDDDNIEVVSATLNALAEIGGEDAIRYLRDYRERVPEELEETLEEATEAASGEIHTLRSIAAEDDEEDDV